MHIGVNTLFLIPDEVGGSETYIVQTLLAIMQNHPDIKLTLFTNLENDFFFRGLLQPFPLVSFHLLPFQARNRPHRILREQLQLPLVVRCSKVDVLWSPGYTAPLFTACPQAVTILDMQYKTHPEDLSSAARLATDVLIRLAATRCRTILTISNFSKSEILKFTTAKPEAVHVTHLAANQDFIPAEPPNAVRSSIAHLLTFNEPYLLCVAHTYPHKNVASLVQAFGNIQYAVPHHLVLVGKPRRGEPKVEEALRRLTNPSRVHRLQNTSQAELIALYQCADLFIFPSLYEGFGLPVLEAMTAETLVVAARKGSVPEVGGGCVFYFTPEEKGDMERQILTTLCLSEDVRRNRILHARNHARKFSWEQTARETLTRLRQTGFPFSVSGASDQKLPTRRSRITDTKRP